MEPARPQLDEAYLWQVGAIASWYLWDYQLPIYEFIAIVRNPFVETTRRFGKTCTVLTRVQERSRIHEARVTLWCEPWKEQARNIVMPEMERIQASCPPRLKAKFYRTDSFYEFPTTGSRLYLLGVNEDKGEGARGRYAHEIVADEFGSWSEARYIKNEVFLPMLLTTGGHMITMSTPPDDLDHYYYEEKAHAIIDGRFIQRTIDTVTSISEAEKQAFIESMGGRNSPAVRRELYCEPVSDPERLVIPEYNEDLHDVPDDYPRPEHFDAYVGVDLGVNDCSAFLFGYFDFLKTELVIEDELVVNGKNTGWLVAQCKDKEKALWGEKAPYLRWGDNELQQLLDMQVEHGYVVHATRKDDKLAAINALRLRFGEVKIKIKKRCQSLRFQLKVGLWNERKTEFLRGEKTGHLDAIDALIYLSRNVNAHHNPAPQLPDGVTHHTHFIPDTSSQRKEEDALAEVFAPFSSGFFGRG